MCGHMEDEGRGEGGFEEFQAARICCRPAGSAGEERALDAAAPVRAAAKARLWPSARKRLADRPAADSSTAAARGRRTKPADEGMASEGGSRKIASVTDWIPSQIARRGF